MTNLRILAVAGLTMLMASPAGAYVVKAPIQCPDVVREDAIESFRLMNQLWLLGYVTGRNYANDGSAGESVGIDEIYRIALDFCQEYPDSDWDDAAIHTYDQLE